MSTVKFKNGNTVTMGKIRPNNSNYYSSVLSHNANVVSGLPTVNSDSYRLMTPSSTFKDASPLKISNSSTIVGGYNEEQRVNRPHSSNGISNRFNKTTPSLLPSTSSNDNGSGIAFQSLTNRSSTPLRNSRQYVTPSFPTMNSTNSHSNTQGILFSSSQPISSMNNVFSNHARPGSSNSGSNSTSNGNQYNYSGTLNNNKNINGIIANNSNSSSSNNNSQENTLASSRKNSFQRSQTAPVISTLTAAEASQLHSSYESSSAKINNTTATAAAGNNLQPLLFAVDGKRDWNIRDSITMPPIKHNPSNDIIPSFNSLFRDENTGNTIMKEEPEERSNNALPGSNSIPSSSSHSYPKSLKKAVRFAEPIAVYEPMTNTLRNRIINDVRAAATTPLTNMSSNPSGNTTKLELKSVLKVSSGYSHSNTTTNNPSHSSSPSPLNSSILSINTMNNTLSNKTVATKGLTAAGMRPISAPANSKHQNYTSPATTPTMATTTTQPNPILTTRDQVVKKSLLEIQNRIMTNLNTLSQESELLIKEEKERRSIPSSPTGKESVEGDKKSLLESSLLFSSGDRHSGSNNSPIEHSSPHKRPKSASVLNDLSPSKHHHQHHSMNTMKSLIAPTTTVAATSSPRSFLNNNNTPRGKENIIMEENKEDLSKTNITEEEREGAITNTNSRSSMSSSTPLFTVMAKSILIGNFSCRVVNQIQFYEDRLEFLFPVMDFTTPSLFTSTTTGNTLQGSIGNSNTTTSSGNYSSLKPLTIAYQDLSNINLLSNKMRCRLAPKWFLTMKESEAMNNNSNNTHNSGQTSHGYLCIEFSNLSYMMVIREKIIPMITKQ